MRSTKKLKNILKYSTFAEITSSSNFIFATDAKNSGYCRSFCNKAALENNKKTQQKTEEKPTEPQKEDNSKILKECKDLLAEIQKLEPGYTKAINDNDTVEKLNALKKELQDKLNELNKKPKKDPNHGGGPVDKKDQKIKGKPVEKPVEDSGKDEGQIIEEGNNDNNIIKDGNIITENGVEDSQHGLQVQQVKQGQNNIKQNKWLYSKESEDPEVLNQLYIPQHKIGKKNNPQLNIYEKKDEVNNNNGNGNNEENNEEEEKEDFNNGNENDNIKNHEGEGEQQVEVEQPIDEIYEKEYSENNDENNDKNENTVNKVESSVEINEIKEDNKQEEEKNNEEEEKKDEIINLTQEEKHEENIEEEKNNEEEEKKDEEENKGEINKIINDDNKVEEKEDLTCDKSGTHSLSSETMKIVTTTM